MTIFLTTQYLEEADELAHRVGIIADGRLQTEGSPADLKRSVGTDLIVAEVAGDAGTAIAALQSIVGVDKTEVHGNEVSMSTPDGAAVIAKVAVALNNCGVPINSLTLRTPTLDDVFLYVTGGHLEGGSDSHDSSLGDSHK